MIVAIQFPDFVIDSTQIQQPQLVNTAFIVVEYEQTYPTVVAASLQAQYLGISKGLTLTKARMIAPSVTVIAFDRGYYDVAIGRLLAVLSLFGETIEIEMSGDSLMVNLDMGTLKSADRKRFLSKIQNTLRRHTQLQYRIGVSNTIFTAQIAAKCTRRDTVHTVLPNYVNGFLKTKSITTLPCADSIITQLELVGVTTLGHLRDLPRTALFARFGKDGVRLHDLANGKDTRKIQPYSAPTFEVVVWQGDNPIEDRQTLEHCVEKLAQKLHTQCQERHLQGQDFVLSLGLDNAQQIVESIETRFPIHQAKTLVEKFQHRIEHIPFSAGVVAITLYARNLKLTSTETTRFVQSIRSRTGYRPGTDF